jgi:hypothetical protein
VPPAFQSANPSIETSFFAENRCLPAADTRSADRWQWQSGERITALVITKDPRLTSQIPDMVDRRRELPAGGAVLDGLEADPAAVAPLLEDGKDQPFPVVDKMLYARTLFWSLVADGCLPAEVIR